MDDLSLANRIFSECTSAAEPEWIADVLARLVWLTADNGAAICEDLRAWLTEGSRAQAACALAFDEVFLWHDEAEMDELLSAVRLRFPDLATRCDEACNRWAAQFPRA